MFWMQNNFKRLLIVFRGATPWYILKERFSGKVVVAELSFNDWITNKNAKKTSMLDEKKTCLMAHTTTSVHANRYLSIIQFCSWNVSAIRCQLQCQMPLTQVKLIHTLRVRLLLTSRSDLSCLTINMHAMGLFWFLFV